MIVTMNSKSSDYRQIAYFMEKLDYAFQPIINSNTGVCIGYEALLRYTDKIGFTDIKSFFDFAYNSNILVELNTALIEKAVSKFCELDFHNKVKLFYNIDTRVIEDKYFNLNNIIKITEQFKIIPSTFIFELSELYCYDFNDKLKYLINSIKDYGFKIAVDDFGTGFSGLQLLYFSEPDFVKVDRFFIQNIANDPKKKMFIAKVLNLIHVLGNSVIAEGIETEEEFLICKEFGCDFVQGYLIQKPTTDITSLKYNYDIVISLSKKSKRTTNSDHQLIHEQLEYIVPIIFNKTGMEKVFEMFKENSCVTFFPVIQEDGTPLGLIREKDLKKYVYSKYGRDILLNNYSSKTMKDFITICPTTEIYKTVEKVLDIFTMDEKSEGIIITENSKYLGFLSANSLLKALHEKNVAIAMDQNPLTKLPGNNSINEYISDTYSNKNKEFVYVYFDFDNFKPFNDKYGFRIGDRGILLFSNILREYEAKNNFFIGHIGGDDFFAGVEINIRLNFQKILKKIKNIVMKFKDDIIAFYNDEDRKNSYIISNSRDGEIKKFPLLAVSAVVLNLTKKRVDMSLEELTCLLSEYKKDAKKSPDKISIQIL